MSNINLNYNNNEGIYSSNLNQYQNIKNTTLNSQISLEIDRQKLKFDEMLEKAKNINNSQNFEFDLKKYLPKDDLFEESKALRKYKHLINPNYSQKINCYTTRTNIDKFKKEEGFNYIKDNNSISEIPIKNENLFDDELSKSDFNFNIKKDEDDNIVIKLNQENLKKNLLNNVNEDNNNIDIKNNKNNQKNIDINNSQTKEDKLINDISKEIRKPFFHIYVEKKSDEIMDKTESNEKNDNDLNEIDRTNIELNYNNEHFLCNNRNNYSWYCLDYFEGFQNNLYEQFFQYDKF